MLKIFQVEFYNPGGPMKLNSFLTVLVIFLGIILFNRIYSKYDMSNPGLKKFYHQEIKTFLDNVKDQEVVYEADSDMITILKLSNDSYENKEFLNQEDFPVILREIEQFNVKDLSLEIQKLRYLHGSNLSLSAGLISDLIQNSPKSELKFEVEKNSENPNLPKFYISNNLHRLPVPKENLDSISSLLAQNGIRLTEMSKTPESWKPQTSSLQALHSDK